jgi:hypothetical protein
MYPMLNEFEPVYERDRDDVLRLIREISRGSEYQRQEQKREKQVKEKLDKYHAKIARAQGNPEYWQQTEVCCCCDSQIRSQTHITVRGQAQGRASQEGAEHRAHLDPR